MKSLKILLIIVLVLGITGISFFGCKDQASTADEEITGDVEEETTEEVSGEKVTLTLWEWHMSEIPDIVGELYSQFEEQYNVELVIDTLPFGDLAQKYLLAAESPDSLPDIGEMWAANLVPTFAEKELLVSLNDYMAQDNLDDYFVDEFLTTYNGNIYSVPVYVGIVAMFINKTMFDTAGITEAPKTWDELVTVAQTLTDATNGEYGMVLNGGDTELLFWVAPFVAQNGGHIGMVDGEIQINSPETVEALQFIVDLSTKYEVLASYTTQDAVTVKEAFMSGKIGMLPDGAWTIPVVQAKNPDFEWETTTLPKGKMDGTALVTGDTEFGIFAKTEHKDLCWEFLKFMTSEENNYFWCKNGTAVSAVKAVAERDELKEDPYLKAFYDQVDKGNVLAFYQELPPQFQEAAETFKVQMQSAVLGEKTVQEAMDIVAVDWQALYDEWTNDYGEWTR